MTHVSREIVERFLAAAVSERPEDMADCYAGRVVIEMPFTAGLYPSRTEMTREQLRQRFAASAAVRRYERLADVRIHESADPVAGARVLGRLPELVRTLAPQ